MDRQKDLSKYLSLYMISIHVDPSKTIRAPYSQWDVIIFGQNAGQQCVAMSLCALIYYNVRGILSPRHLVQIMDVGNQLYSSLSQLARTVLPDANRITNNAYSIRGKSSA